MCSHVNYRQYITIQPWPLPIPTVYNIRNHVQYNAYKTQDKPLQDTLQVQHFTPLLYTTWNIYSTVHIMSSSSTVSPDLSFMITCQKRQQTWSYFSSHLGLAVTNDSDSPLLAVRSLCCPHFAEHCWLWPSLVSRNWKVQVLLRTLLAFKYMRRSFSPYLLHERCERLFKVAFRRRDVDNHEGFGISTQRVLHHLREMKR